MNTVKKSTLPSWIGRLFKWALIIELAWLLLVNSLLQLNLTQDLINKIRPEKFYISWEQAWSPWPGRVYVSGVSGNGNSRSQTWAFQADEASGSITLLALIFKRVWVRNVDGENVSYWQRPRAKPDKDYSAIEPWFPDIEGREPTPAITTPLKKKRPWHVSIKDANLKGSYKYWIFNVRGEATGTVSGRLKVQSRGGPFELDISEIDLALARHTISGTNELFREGTVQGTVGFVPIRFRETKGVKKLDYALLDTTVDIRVNDLSFINLFLLNYESIKVNGEGRVYGRLNYEEGWIRPGTNLSIDADNLAASVMDFRIDGDGEIDLVMDDAAQVDNAQNEMTLNLGFNDLSVQHIEDTRPILTGNGLDLTIGGNGKLVPDPEHVNSSRSIKLAISRLTVPELDLFQRFLPTKWPLKLVGGSGELGGSALLTPTAYGVDLSLASNKAEIALRDFHFETNMDAAIKLENPDVTKHRTRVGGSYIAFKESNLQREDGELSKPWTASLAINEGKFGLFQKDLRLQQSDVVDLFELMGENKFSELIGSSSGEFEYQAEVTSLAWLGVLLSENHDSKVTGSSKITGFTALEDGLLQPGTWLDVQSENLGVTVLDYISQGGGSIRLDVEEGGNLPDWRLGIEVQDGTMKRIDSTEPPPIHDVDLKLSALVRDVTLEPKKSREFDLRLEIPSARLTNVAIFNEDLPPDGPFQFVEGEANLSADILLQAENADGYIRLVAPDTHVLLDGQDIEAAMQINIDLAGGVPRERTFDFSGSDILVNNVRIKADNTELDDEGWNARLVLTRGLTTWTPPATMDLEADLTVSDSRPLVALFENGEGWKPDFLVQAITVEDIKGNALVEMSDRQIIIPSLTLQGGDLEAAAKAWIKGEENRGMLWARYKRLDALVKFTNGKRNIDVINALKTYEAYEPLKVSD